MSMLLSCLLLFQFCGVCLQLKDPFLVFEFIEGKSLEVLLFGRHGRGKETISLENKFQIAFDVARGMAYLHSGVNGEDEDPIIHRDLKPDNILVCVLSISILVSSPLNQFLREAFINILFLVLFSLCSLSLSLLEIPLHK